MDFSDTSVFSTSMDLSDCQLKTVLRARPAVPEFSLSLSDNNSDEDPDYEPASDEEDEDRLEFDSHSSQYLTSDDGSSSEYEDVDGTYSRKRKFKRMKMWKNENACKALNSIWVVQAAEVYYNGWKRERVVQEKIVGSFSSKSDAIENARLAMSNLPSCEDLFGKDGYMENSDETGWSVMEDTSDSIGDQGGIFFKVEDDEGSERYVSITRVNLDQPIIEGNTDESESEQDEDEYS